MKKDRNTLKSYFNTGDYPTEQQFGDLIDSFLSVEGDDVSSGGVSILMDSFDGGKFFSIGAQGVSSYLSMDANGNAVFGSNSSSDGQDSHLLVKRNGGLEFSDRGTVHKVWHSGNDGSGSGLDADLLDGVQGISYARKDINTEQVFNGRLAVANSSPVVIIQDTNNTGISQTGFISFQDNSGTEQGWIGFGYPDNNYLSLYNTYDPINGVRIGNLFRVWHEGNDGSGSGLDADLLDGTHGTYFDHRVYNDQNNYLGGGYNSGGLEKPSFFERGKLKLQMLRGVGGNLGATPSYWNDVLWLSSYSGSDVKGSNALIFGKETDAIGFCRQNYDSTSWGTYRAIWHSGANNITTGTCTASNFILSSDERIKKNIRPIEDIPILISWKTFSMTESTDKRYGVVAQELEIKHPEFVRTDEKGYKSVAYIDLLVAKMAEKDRQMLKLDDKIEKKDKQIGVLTKRLDEIEIQVQRILATI